MITILLFTVVICFLLHKLLLSVGSKPKWWKAAGVTEIDASSVASPLQILLGAKAIHERDNYGYNQMKERGLSFCGMLEKPCPVILLKDLELVKKILIRDFDHFVDRRDFFTVTDQSPIRNFLGFMKGEDWRATRHTVSPTFGTGKVRRVMEHFNFVGKEWTEELLKKSKGNPIDVQVLDFTNQFTIDVIGRAVFGIDPGAVKDPKSKFAEAAFRMIGVNFWQKLKQDLSPRYPALFKLLNIEFLDSWAMKFLENIAKQSLEHRKNSNEKRNNFQEFLLEAREEAGDNQDAQGNGKIKKKPLTDKLIMSQLLLFIVAGFFATSAGIASALHMLALHPDIQEKLRKEVEEIVKEDGTLDYDDLGKLTYLDMVVAETLRWFPAFTRLERVVEKDYKDPDSGLEVKKCSVMVIPVVAIHNDKKYYANPEKFDPEHFSEEAKKDRHPMAYLPFGAGQRNCIGMRFGIVEVKAALAYAINRFKVEPNDKTQNPAELVPTGILTVPPADLGLRFIPI